MKNQWLMTLLLAPLLFPSAMAVEAYSLYAYMLEAGALPAPGEHHQDNAVASPVMGNASWTRVAEGGRHAR